MTGQPDDQRHPLEAVLGHRFKDQTLLTRALTHRSLVGMRKAGGAVETDSFANERLEFLGDRVLGLQSLNCFSNDSPMRPRGNLRCG